MRFLITIIILITTFTSQAQKMGLRFSYNRLLSYRTIDILSINSIGNNTLVSEKINANNPFKGVARNYIPNLSKQSGFLDISLFYNFTNRKTILIGFRNINPLIGASISVTKNSNLGTSTLTYTYSQSISIPTLKLNYSYLITNKKKSPQVNVFGGLLLHFKGKDRTFESNKTKGVVTKYYDSNGSLTTYAYILVTKKKSITPNSITPYYNIGFDIHYSIGKRILVGTELSSFFGFNSLYSEEYQAETHESQIKYRVNIKRLFFSGGIYLQYNFR